MENQEVKAPETISYFTFESVRATMERTVKRLWILVIILVGLLVATNAGWMIYEAQFEDVVVAAEQQADGNGINYAIGGDFDGSAPKSDNQNPAP